MVFFFFPLHYHKIVDFLLWCKFDFAKHTATAAAVAQKQMSGSLMVPLMCADSDVGASKCKLISDWGILCVRREIAFCCTLSSDFKVCRRLCNRACVCLWVVMHVAMHLPCLSSMCFCLWEWWMAGRQLMWFRCSTRRVFTCLCVCVRVQCMRACPFHVCAVEPAVYVCVSASLPPSSSSFFFFFLHPSHPASFFFPVLCSFWTLSK